MTQLRCFRCGEPATTWLDLRTIADQYLLPPWERAVCRGVCGGALLALWFEQLDRVTNAPT